MAATCIIHMEARQKKCSIPQKRRGSWLCVSLTLESRRLASLSVTFVIFFHFLLIF